MNQQEQDLITLPENRFLSGGGELEKLIRFYDWGNTSIGSIDAWPQSLRTAVNICLHSKYPSLVLWGEEMVRIYNDAYTTLIGNKHPAILGSKGKEGFPEGWQKVGNLFETTYSKGVSGSIENQLIRIDRNGYPEDYCFSFSANPIFNELGEVGGVFVNITETSEAISRKKIEESEERLRMAIASTKLGTWDYNPISGELNWSAECRAIYAFPPDKEISFQVFSDHIHPEDKEFALGEINKALDPSGTGCYDITFRILRYDDRSPRWIRATGKVYFNAQQQADRFIGTVVDTTEQKIMIRELEESEKRFKTMADTAPAMIWTSGTDKQFDFFNKGWLSFTGRTLDNELGSGWMESIHPDDRIRCIDIYNTSFDLRKKFSMEYRMKRHDDKYRWISNDGAPRYSSDGGFLGYIGTCLDIQERKMAREELERKVLERTSELNRSNSELRQQKEFVDTILESSVDIIVVLDQELRYVTYNRAACQYYSVKKGELIGKKILDIFPLIKTSGMYDDLQEALKGKTIHNPKYRSTVLDKHFGNFYIPLKDRNDKVYGVLLISHDNTAIVDAAEKLEVANRILEEKNLALERSNKELESFSYVASHDLQEPLRKIRTFSGLVQKHYNNEKEAKKYFKKIDSSAERMADLIKAVLNYSRLSKTDDHFVETNLNAILKNVKSDFELLILEKKAVIKSSKLPVVRGVPLQLNQLFSNLIGNSIKFSEKAPVVSVTSKIIQADEMPIHPDIQQGCAYVELIFKDNGIGFEQQYSDQIFTIFKRLHGHHAYSGTGIGLALCKKIVENHRGFIAVQSEPGKGAEFFVYLPIK